MVYSPWYPLVKRTLSHEMISRLYMANPSESNTGQLLRTDQILIYHFITAFQSCCYTSASVHILRSQINIRVSLVWTDRG